MKSSWLPIRITTMTLATLSPLASTMAADIAGPVEEVVVSGSRLIVSGVDAPTPVTVLTAEALAAKSPASIPEGLRQLPEFMGSTGAYSTSMANTTGAAGSNVGGAGTYLNLRGLGNNRMLMLQDGRRIPPNTASGATDANLFPQMLVQRVDVVTGGASAAYGSDAISGVVNFITDKHYEGLKTLVQGGASTHGDMQGYRIGVAGGTAMMDGRLHLIGSAELYDNEGIDRQARRPNGNYKFWAAGGRDGAVGAGTAANPYVYYPGVHFTGSSFAGLANTGPLAGNQIINGQLVPLNQGTLVTPSTCIDCPDSYVIVGPEVTLVPEVHTEQFFGRAEYEISDNLTAWVLASYTESRTRGTATSGFFNRNITIFRENAYLTDSIRDLLGSTESFTFSHAFDKSQLPHADLDLQPNTRNVLASLEGRFGGSWAWDLTYTNGRSETEFQSNQLFLRNAFAAFDAVTDPQTGNPVCRVTLTNPGLYPGCEPFNLFGAGVASAAAAAYIQGRSIYNDVTDMQSVELNLRGEPFSLWAGPVGIAAGVEYREQEYALTSNSAPGSYETTGIRGLGSINPFLVTNLVPSSGKRDVKEGYVEVLVPLAKDLPLLTSLDLNAALRITDYSTSGRVETWKVGTSWKPVDDLRVRATVSRDIRAPSLGELYAGLNRAASPISDPHTGIARVTVDTITGGNPNLQPETSDSLTVGFVYTPSWLDGLQASVDYYSFELKDAISNPYTTQQIVDLCELSNGTDALLCGLVERPLPFSDRTPANIPTGVRTIPVNVAEFTVKGIDGELGYRTPVAAGELGARVLVSYLLQYEQLTAPGQPIRVFDGNADAFGGLPKLRGSVELRYSQGPWVFGLQERYVGDLKHSVLSNSVYADNHISAQYYTDVNVSYELEVQFKTQLFINVVNAFDHLAPLVTAQNMVPSGQFPALASIHDVIGRQIIVGARMNF